MSMINDIYFNYVQTKDYKEHSENEQTEKAYIEIEPHISSVLIDGITSYATEREKLGFVNGFRYAMRIIAECVPEKAMKV